MKTVAIAFQAALSLLTMASPAKAVNTVEMVSMNPKSCTTVLAGMYNDVKSDVSVEVEYTGVELSLKGNGREYLITCEGGELRFVGKISGME